MTFPGLEMILKFHDFSRFSMTDEPCKWDQWKVHWSAVTLRCSLCPPCANPSMGLVEGAARPHSMKPAVGRTHVVNFLNVLLFCDKMSGLTKGDTRWVSVGSGTSRGSRLSFPRPFRSSLEPQVILCLHIDGHGSAPPLMFIRHF